MWVCVCVFFVQLKTCFSSHRDLILAAILQGKGILLSEKSST